MKNINKLFTLFFFLTISISFSQTGKVAGLVNDGEFNEPLAFANVLVKGTITGTTSDFDGRYELELDAGTYTLEFSFVGYDTQEITDIIIQPNQVVDLDITLYTNSLETVVIKTSVKRNTEAAVLDLQKKSVTLLDGLSLQSIKKSGAGDIASAVKNVPGVSVQGGKYVYVRGLGDRYTKSILNGVDIPGLDPDRNTIPMDIFPTNIIDNLIVVKSAAAEYPADFTGGIVDIVTKDFPTKEEYSISVGAAYNPDMHFNENYLTSEKSNTDFLGYDNGDRDMPINRYQPIPGTFDNSSILTTLTNSFNKELKAKKENSGMNYSFGLTAGNQFDVGDNKLGYQVAVGYKNNTKFYEERVDGAYSRNTDNTDQYELEPTRLTYGSEGINEVLLSGLAGLTFKTDLSKYRLNFLHIQNGESSAGFFNQFYDEGNVGSTLIPLTKDAITYTERSVTNLLVNGNHSLGVDTGWKLDWKFSPSLSRVFDKDHKITPFRVSDDGSGIYTISPSASSYPTRIWRNLQEENWVGKIDLVKTYELFKNPAKLKVGGGYVFKYRDFSIDDYDFTSTTRIVEDGNANNLLTPENLWTVDNQSGTYLVFGQEFEAANAYEGEQNIASAYISNEFNVTEKLKAIVGLRTEAFKMYYTGQKSGSGTEVFNHVKTLDEYDLFPSANLIYALNDDSNIRASYSKTTARPSFKEKSASRIFDPITNRTFVGNLNGFTDVSGDLIYGEAVPSYMNNIDLRYEWFRENGQMIAVSGFYKDFKDPLEIVFFPTAADQLTVANLGNANVFGFELEFRQGFNFISEGLKNLRLNLNASIIDSKLTMSEAEYERRTSPIALRPGETVERERDLQGQSPYLINVGLDYAIDESSFRTGLFYNVQGKSLEVVGTGVVPDVYTKPFHSMNFTLNKAFGEDKKSSISLKVNNILGNEKESVYESFKADDEIFSLRNPGTEFSLGYSYKF